MTEDANRYDTLIVLAARYRALAEENYARIRALAEALQSGFCAYLNSAAPPCVLLVPPAGPFEPRAYGDRAFSTPPTGFQALGPILFGLAVRVSETNDWIRVTMECAKEGENFTVSMHGGASHTFRLPLYDQDPSDFFAALYQHVSTVFSGAIDDYEHGRYGVREMGFDFSDAPASEETA